MSRADVMAGRSYVSLYVKQNALIKGLRSAKQRLSEFGSSMQATGRAAVAVAAGMLAPLVLSAKTFADFDDAMRAVKGVTQANDDELSKLTETAKLLGRTTSFTAIEIGGLMAELGRAGFKTDEIDAMTLSVLNLARATGTDATLSAGIMSSTLRQFSLGAADAGRVADVLAAGANSSFMTVTSLGESLSYAGKTASDMGMSLEETVAIVGSLGNVGIQGSMAGTSLKRLSVISAAELGKLEGIFEVSLRNSAGAGLPLVDMLEQIAIATNGLDQNSRIEKLNEAFGLLGISGALSIGGAVTETRALTTTLENAQGVAAKTAKEMDGGLGGAFRIIISAAEGVRLAIGEAISKPLERTVKAITGLFGAITESISQNQQAVVTYGKIALAIGVFGGALMTVGLVAAFASIVIGGLIGVITFGTAIIGGIISVILGLGSALSTLPGILIALAAVVLARMGAFDNIANGLQSAFGKIGAVFSQTFGLILDALAAGDIAAAGQIAMLGLQLAFAEGVEGLFGLFGDVGGEIVSALVGQILSGDLSGAWETVIVGMATVWESFATAIGSIWTDVNAFIGDTWKSTVDGLRDTLLSFAAEGGVVNEILFQISGVDFAKEVKRQQKLNSDMKAAGMNPSSDSGIEYSAPEASIQTASDDETVVDNIKTAAATRKAAAQANIANLREELDFMKAGLEDKKQADEEKSKEESKAGSEAGSGARASSVGKSSVVTSSAAALMSIGRTGQNSMAKDVNKLVGVNEKANEIAKESAKQVVQAVAEGAGIPVL